MQNQLCKFKITFTVVKKIAAMIPLFNFRNTFIPSYILYWSHQ